MSRNRRGRDAAGLTAREPHYRLDRGLQTHPLSHNEGIHGRLKGDEIDIGNPKHRPAPGQVAQTLLVALMVTAGNLDILETRLYQRTGTQLTDSVFDNTDPQPPTWPETEPPAQAARPPPPATGR